VEVQRWVTLGVLRITLGVHIHDYVAYMPVKGNVTAWAGNHAVTYHREHNISIKWWSLQTQGRGHAIPTIVRFAFHTG